MQLKGSAGNDVLRGNRIGWVVEGLGGNSLRWPSTPAVTYQEHPLGDDCSGNQSANSPAGYLTPVVSVGWPPGYRLRWRDFRTQAEPERADSTPSLYTSGLRYR